MSCSSKVSLYQRGNESNRAFLHIPIFEIPTTMYDMSSKHKNDLNTKTSPVRYVLDNNLRCTHQSVRLQMHSSEVANTTYL